jgi:cell shape-determining protein MreC
MTTPGEVKGSIVFMKNIVASTQSTYHTSNASVNKVAITSEGGVVYINLGKGDGVKPGDLFIVYNGKFAIGEIAVLKVEDKSSSALVTYSVEALVLGDRVERR